MRKVGKPNPLWNVKKIGAIYKLGWSFGITRIGYGFYKEYRFKVTDLQTEHIHIYYFPIVYLNYMNLICLTVSHWHSVAFRPVRFIFELNNCRLLWKFSICRSRSGTLNLYSLQHPNPTLITENSNRSAQFGTCFNFHHISKP